MTQRHRRIHLDGNEQFRVHSGCETVANMQPRDWFVLPPIQEFYWRQHHSEYRSLPPWRRDCPTDLLQVDEDQPMELVYPNEESRIYIPMDLDGKRSRVILKAVHRNPAAKLYWHLDDEFLGETQFFHEREAALKLLNTSEKIDAAAKRHPLQKVGDAKDVAAMAAFLLSPHAIWISGQILHVDGGMSTLYITWRTEWISTRKHWQRQVPLTTY